MVAQFVDTVVSKLTELINDVVRWVVWSSASPKATSLTVKAFLAAFLTYITVVAGLGHVVLPIDQLSGLFDLVVQWVQTGLLFVSITVGIFGAVRKVYLTIAGKNPVVSQ